jgi:putative endonuclease
LVRFCHDCALIRAARPHSVAATMTGRSTGPLAALLDHRAKSLGRRGEDLAAAHYERLGYRVLARNHRTRFGELDLVLTDADERTIVFCEVKTRRGGSADVWENLHEAKRRQVRSMAAAWLAEVRERPWAAELRFDAIGVTVDAHGKLLALDHLEAAF